MHPAREPVQPDVEPAPERSGHEDGSGLSALLQAAAGGDQGAWRQVIELYGRRVFALVRSRLRRMDLAEEVTQSVFVTVATKLSEGAYSERGRFEAWLFRVAVNRVRDEIRRLRRHAEPTDPATLSERVAPGASDPASGLSSGAEQDAALVGLRRAMAELGDADREVIELRHHAGLPFAQISELLGEPLGTLLARHHRALRKIKDIIARNDQTREDDD